MAEITKITTPLMPKENTGNKYKPVSDQAFELNDISRVQKPVQDKTVGDQQAGKQQAPSLHSTMMRPLFREAGQLLHAIQKMAMLIELGVSASDALSDPELQEALRLLFVPPQHLLETLQQQEQSAVLFKGESFSILRDLLARFEGNPRIASSIASVLKAFEHNVNTEYSIRTILYHCRNILDYLFSSDREQFSTYLQSLSEMLLPQNESATQQADSTSTSLSHREMAQILKGNLLPLLGEIVVKYHQNERIRDMVMVVVHNIVRVDQGSPEALEESLQKLVQELRRVANLPADFEDNVLQMLQKDAGIAKQAQNEVLSKLTDLISRTLHSPDSNPATVRQAESLLMALLQNQSAAMDVLHFILPMQTEQGTTIAELFVDPDSSQNNGRSGKQARKLFLTLDSEVHGSFELSFLQIEDRVDFSMWCPEILVKHLAGLRRQIGDLMQLHGYTMNSFAVSELVEPQSIAQVFPELLNRRSGVDVRI